MNANIELSAGGGAILFLPIPGISKIPFGAPKKLVKNMKEVNQFLLNQIESHERNADLDNPRDFIDLYLKKMAETKVGIFFTEMIMGVPPLQFLRVETK